MISVEIISANFTFLGQTICIVYIVYESSFTVLLPSAGWFVCVRMLVGYIDSLSQKGMSLHPVCYGPDGYLRMRCVKSA